MLKMCCLGSRHSLLFERFSLSDSYFSWRSFTFTHDVSLLSCFCTILSWRFHCLEGFIPFLAVMVTVELCHMNHNARNGPSCGLQTMQAQISLLICAGWSEPSLSAYRINGYCSICWGTENVQIRLHGCACSSGSLLFPYGIRAFFPCYALYEKATVGLHQIPKTHIIMSFSHFISFLLSFSIYHIWGDSH